MAVRTTMPVPGDRAAFRAWVRTHHPDVGGDPAEFAEGLRRHTARGPVAADRVIGVRRRRWPIGRLARWRERRERARRLL
jgi:hypothetical protein